MKRVFLTGPVMKVLGAAGAILVFALTVYLMSGMPAAREADRVGPSDGSFSMIKPRTWESRITYAPADKIYRVTMDLRDPKSIEINQRIAVARLLNPPDFEKLKKDGYLPGKFEDRDAMILWKLLRKEFVWRAVFERTGVWYEMLLVLPRETDVPNSEWWPFLSSFRAGASAPATTSTTK